MSVQATISEKCGAEEPALGENLQQFGEQLWLIIACAGHNYRCQQVWVWRGERRKRLM
eukprot:COSAG04_NODE_24101_length_327_cov_0.907895_1_plen_57_part_10